MTFQLILRSSSRPTPSPYRLLHQLAKIDHSILLDYVRYQLDQLPKPAPSTVNHRLAVLGCLYHFHYGCEIPGSKAHFHRSYTTRSPLGYGRPRRRVTTVLRLRQPRYLVVPLSADQVAGFWKSFRTFRDLAIVALMLLAPAKFFCSSSKISRSPKHIFVSSAKATRNASCHYQLKLSRSSKTISAAKGLSPAPLSCLFPGRAVGVAFP